LHWFALVHAAHTEPCVPGTQTPRPLSIWQVWPLGQESGVFTSQRLRHTGFVAPTQARPVPQAASVVDDSCPQGSPSVWISSGQAQVPPPPLSEKHA
jgi:hypothetical protein